MLNRICWCTKCWIAKLVPLYCNQRGRSRGRSEPIPICWLPGWTLNPAGIRKSGMHCGKYGCESTNVCWWYMCSAPVLVGCNVFWIFVVTIVEFALHPQHEASCDSEIQTGKDFKNKSGKQLQNSPTTSLNSEGKEETLECLKSWTELKKNEDGHWICKHLIYKDVVLCIYLNYRIFTLRLQ